MAKPPRPRTLAAIFGVFFAVIAFVANGFAQAQTTAWFGPDISRWIYSLYMLIAAVFLVGLGGLGLSIRRSFARQIRDLERQIESGGDSQRDALPPPLPESAGSRDHVDRDIDELLESLSEIEETTSKEAEVMEREAAGGGVGSYVDPGLVAQRDRMARRQKMLGRFLLGPGVVAATVLGLSGIMLPGVEGFAQTNFHLNTALILGMSYSWLGVGVYIALTIFALVSARDDRRRK